MARHSSSSVRRTAAFGFTAAAAVVLAAALAFACTVPQGVTYFTDGTTEKSVVRGGRISAFAYGANPGDGYKLVIGSSGPHAGHACHDINFTVNDAVRFPTSEGFIGPTAGRAGSEVTGVPAAGTYQLCFRNQNVADATAAATITIL